MLDGLELAHGLEDALRPYTHRDRRAPGGKHVFDVVLAPQRDIRPRAANSRSRSPPIRTIRSSPRTNPPSDTSEHLANSSTRPASLPFSDAVKAFSALMTAKSPAVWFSNIRALRLRILQRSRGGPGGRTVTFRSIATFGLNKLIHSSWNVLISATITLSGPALCAAITSGRRISPATTLPAMYVSPPVGLEYLAGKDRRRRLAVRAGDGDNRGFGEPIRKLDLGDDLDAARFWPPQIRVKPRGHAGAGDDQVDSVKFDRVSPSSELDAQRIARPRQLWQVRPRASCPKA